jgi:hypothetical protein
MIFRLDQFKPHDPSMVASAGETDLDLAGRQFPRNCVVLNIIILKLYNFIMFYNVFLVLKYNFIIL